MTDFALSEGVAAVATGGSTYLSGGAPPVFDLFAGRPYDIAVLGV